MKVVGLFIILVRIGELKTNLVVNNESCYGKHFSQGRMCKNVFLFRIQIVKEYYIVRRFKRVEDSIDY